MAGNAATRTVRLSSSTGSGGDTARGAADRPPGGGGNPGVGQVGFGGGGAPPAGGDAPPREERVLAEAVALRPPVGAEAPAPTGALVEAAHLIERLAPVEHVAR